MSTSLIADAPLTDDELLDRFRPIFERIAEGALEREKVRRVPIEEATWLRDSGFGAIRVPREFGGLGATQRQLFTLLIELGAAESNLVQALRVHFRFTEDRLRERDTERGQFWLRRIADGAIVGNASSEREGNVRGRTNTTLRANGDTFLLNGTKYYSTGSLYADYISVAVTDDDGQRVTALVRSDAPGLRLIDDYSGFGQRTSGSGTTILTDVVVQPQDIIGRQEVQGGQLAGLQLTHLAALSGIVRAAVDETAEFVRRRRRSYSQGNADLPREDPQVQQVIGRVDAVAYATKQIVLGAVGELDAATDARFALRVTAPEDRTPEAEAAVKKLELAAELGAYRAQTTVIDLALRATAEVFEVGGSSALDESLHLDRHWRNARTLSSHNPAIYRERGIGDFVLNGTEPVHVPSVGIAPALAEPGAALATP
ncbi:acyl-CoA dehydrogenase family protein [Rhodococcoides kyotonense]|uniref:Dibenzothiophene monooxygenase n=1 Tax=Rhodococcoides kyotonense TaxID=398843 RepID=A0A239H822_9NOCA|nr:acyl-CoA dehydrogenase family protein [Rhodococcus kyotonensis]SNS77295.1 Acyl-CoA dehydrogenase [Rhodococcus kyotonensis]